VISPIGRPGTDTWIRSDRTFRHLIEPAVSSHGYAAHRADQDPRSGLITPKLLRDVIESDLVVADLTDHNPNVYYELAVRHVTQKPIVQIIARGQTLPFDVSDTRTIAFDIQNLDDVAAAREQIKDYVKALETESRPVETPISMAGDLRLLSESDEPLAPLVAEIASNLASLQAEVRAERSHRSQGTFDSLHYTIPASQTWVSTYMPTSLGIDQLSPEDEKEILKAVRRAESEKPSTPPSKKPKRGDTS